MCLHYKRVGVNIEEKILQASTSIICSNPNVSVTALGSAWLFVHLEEHAVPPTSLSRLCVRLDEFGSASVPPL